MWDPIVSKTIIFFKNKYYLNLLIKKDLKSGIQFSNVLLHPQFSKGGSRREPLCICDSETVSVAADIYHQSKVLFYVIFMI